MNRVLVTGATGYIGGHLVARLVQEGIDVRCLVRRLPTTGPLVDHQVECVVGELEDEASIRSATTSCDTVFHLAGRTSAWREADLTRTNGLGTHRVAQACANRPGDTPPTLIVISSLAAAGSSPHRRLRDERAAPRPTSAYGRSKRAGEVAAEWWAGRVPTSVIRPGIVFGPSNREVLPMFQSIAKAGFHATPGFQSRRVALIHHDDLIELMIQVAERGGRLEPPENEDARRGRRDQPPENVGYYFAAAPEAPTYPELGRMIAQALGRPRVLVLPVSDWFVWLLAVGNQTAASLMGVNTSLNLDKMREAFAGDWVCATDRAARELGFRPARDLQTRLDETATWYLDQGWL